MNNSTPALNATNLNKLQDNVEDAIDAVQDDVDSLGTNKLDKTNVKTTNTTSDTDTYSCNYINENIQDVYSNNETRIGTWIDGKPIYRKVINSTKTNIQSLINNLNIDTPIRFDGLANSDYGYTWPENTTYTVESGYSNWYHWSQTTPRTITWEFEGHYKNSNLVMVILEYTKTTDT